MDSNLSTILGLAAIFGILIGMMLIAYEDGVHCSRWKKIRCKMGWHKIRFKLYGMRINKYYCEYCKVPRKHPVLRVIEGGRKFGNNKFDW